LIRMPHLLAVRTYVVLAVACLLGFGGGALLAAADSPNILFYVLGVLLVGLYTLQALKPGVGVRPFRKGSTERSGRHERASPADETQDQPSTGVEPSTTDAEPSKGIESNTLSVNYGLAGGLLDATERVERARKTVREVNNWGYQVSTQINREAAARSLSAVG
jgi:uncharacterized membrane protein YfcA